MSTFASRLKELRSIKNISVVNAAKEIGISQGVLSDYERGAKLPGYEAIQKICKYYNVSSDYLLCLSDAKQPENSDIVERLGLTESNIAKFERIKKCALDDESKTVYPNADVLQAVNDIIAALFKHDVWLTYADLCDVVLSFDSAVHAKYLLSDERENLEQAAKEYGFTIVDGLQDSAQHIQTFITVCNFWATDLAKPYNDILKKKKEDAEAWLITLHHGEKKDSRSGGSDDGDD